MYNFVGCLSRPRLAEIVAYSWNGLLLSMYRIECILSIYESMALRPASVERATEGRIYPYCTSSVNHYLQLY